MLGKWCIFGVFLVILGLCLGFLGSKMCVRASLEVDWIVQSNRLGVGENLKQLQHDFNLFLKVLGKMHQHGGYFWSFLGSDGDPWGHKCAAGLPKM